MLEKPSIREIKNSVVEKYSNQAVIKKLLHDNLAGLTDSLPIVNIGEALIVGDASLLPTRINIWEPKIKPQSATVNFWREWSKDGGRENIKML